MIPKREERLSDERISWIATHYTEDDIRFLMARELQSLRSSPAGGGGDGIQGPASGVVQNKEENK